MSRLTVYHNSRCSKSRGTLDLWLKILSENPILIERPIVTDGKTAVTGRPPENALKLIRK